jgi:hypothetical protein
MWFTWLSSFREDFLEIDQSEKKLPVVAMFVNGSGRNEKFYRESSIDVSYQVSVHFAEISEKKIFRN